MAFLLQVGNHAGKYHHGPRSQTNPFAIAAFTWELHTLTCPYFNHLQPPYRPLHSVETALLRTLDNIFHSSKQAEPYWFPMTYHSILILLNRLYTSFGISGVAFS